MNSEKLIFDDGRIDFLKANEMLLQMGATDGLPVVPAASETVSDWMTFLGIEDPETPIAVMMPLMKPVTHVDLVVNAIMAGARVSAVPVLRAAVQAVCEDPFNLSGILTTTGSATPALLVNGPVRGEIDINSKGNCLGPGYGANAVIGRALRLILINTGGAVPGAFDMATIGQPGKFTFCFGENEEESPWPPFHVTRGYEAGESVVTAFGAGGTLEAVDPFATCAEDLLMTLARSALIAGNLGLNGMIGSGETLFVIPPEVATLMARDGYTREKAQAFIFENARTPLAYFPPTGQKRLASFRQTAGLDEDAPVCIADDPEGIILIVAGGVGVKCCLIPTWNGGTRAVSKALLQGSAPPPAEPD